MSADYRGGSADEGAGPRTAYKTSTARRSRSAARPTRAVAIAHHLPCTRPPPNLSGMASHHAEYRQERRDQSSDARAAARVVGQRWNRAAAGEMPVGGVGPEIRTPAGR